jgi:hypothetical protein
MGSSRIPNEIKRLYQDIWLTARRQGRDLSRFQVEQAAQMKLSKKGLVNARLPKKRAAQELIKETREQYEAMPEEEKEQDLSWHMGTLTDHPIPPEALVVVLKIWKSRTKEGIGFTTREAKWASRLSGVIKDTKKLSQKASQYARTELMFKFIGRPFDSTLLDKELMGLPRGVSSFEDFLHILAEQREDKNIKWAPPLSAVNQVRQIGIDDGVAQVKNLVKEARARGKRIRGREDKP